MQSTVETLGEAVLRRLTNDALSTLLGEAAFLELVASPGLQLVLSNEPVADLNMLVVGSRADHSHFQRLVTSCLDRKLPIIVMVFPEAGVDVDDLASNMGLFHAVDFPFMVREDLPLEPSGNSNVDVDLAHAAEDAEANADVLASAYSMPRDSVLRVTPRSFFDTPGADVYLARLHGDVAGTVTLTYHGDTCGIWAMGTRPSLQRGGIGRRLLSAAIGKARSQGVRRFFLGASPAGFPLYQHLGFKTICSARIWVSGETHQD